MDYPENGLSVGLISPHGGQLINRCLVGAEREAALERANNLVQVPLSPANVSDIEMIATGVYSPLTGFMESADYYCVLKDMRLVNGIVWPLPITLPVDNNLAAQISHGQTIALVQGYQTLALMEVTEKYHYNKEEEAYHVYKTKEIKHPGVARLRKQGETLLAGDVQLLNNAQSQQFPDWTWTPAETRQIFKERGWQKIVGFQTRNPLNRSHEQVIQAALNDTDGLFLHPLVGETKKDDIPAEARLLSYYVLLKNYYPLERVLLGVFPATMRFAGPREALFHALCRKNYGCTHFIVGRDHAGVGNYYESQAACEIFAGFSPKEIGIEILTFPEYLYYCPTCYDIVTPKICSHENKRYSLSGTKLRHMLNKGHIPPLAVMRPEVAGVLLQAVYGRKPVFYHLKRMGHTLAREPKTFIPKSYKKLKRWFDVKVRKLETDPGDTAELLNRSNHTPSPNNHFLC